MGKSTANKALVSFALDSERVALVLTLDDNYARAAQYEGTYRSNIAHLKACPPIIESTGPDDPPEDARHIVLRGHALNRNMSESCTPHEIAKAAQEMTTANPDGQVLINIDELGDATNGDQAWLRVDGESRVAQVFRKGRGMGISVAWTTQIPQSLPREAFSLSDTLGLFRLTGNSAEYLVSKRVITPQVARMVEKLPRGKWILYDKSQPWDGIIYPNGG